MWRHSPLKEDWAALQALSGLTLWRQRPRWTWAAPTERRIQVPVFFMEELSKGKEPTEQVLEACPTVQVSPVNLVCVLTNTKENFIGGKIFHAMHNWSSLTSDSFILKYVSGECLDFIELPLQVAPPRPLSFKPSEQIALDLAVNKFLCHGIVEPCEPSSGLCFYSNIFPVLKKDGSARIILNLSDLNVHVEHVHFKMETLKDVIPVVFHKCFFATIDLQDAYYSVPIRPADRDWLRFLWHGKHYRFTCLPQGFTSAPRIFTRLLKPVFALFRKFGLITTCYIDDCIFIAASRDKLMDQLRFALQVFDSLGLTVNVGKSSLTPSQKVEFLGFIIDSVNMSISITSQKQVKIKKLGAQLLLRDKSFN